VPWSVVHDEQLSLLKVIQTTEEGEEEAIQRMIKAIQRFKSRKKKEHRYVR
jgi:hypothetical protein